MAATHQHTPATNPRRRSTRLLDGPSVSYVLDKPKRKRPNPGQTWHAALRVQRQRKFRGRMQYLVDWAGTDPRTGAAYRSSWVSFHDLNNNLYLDWIREKACQAEAAILRRKPVPTPEVRLRLRELEEASAEYFAVPDADDGPDASSSSGFESLLNEWAGHDDSDSSGNHGTQSPLNEEAAHHDARLGGLGMSQLNDDAAPSGDRVGLADEHVPRASDDPNGSCSICEDPEQAEDGVLISPCCGQSMCLHCVSLWKDKPCPFCRARPQRTASPAGFIVI